MPAQTACEPTITGLPRPARKHDGVVGSIFDVGRDVRPGRHCEVLDVGVGRGAHGDPTRAGVSRCKLRGSQLVRIWREVSAREVYESGGKQGLRDAHQGDLATLAADVMHELPHPIRVRIPTIGKFTRDEYRAARCQCGDLRFGT